MSGKTRKIAPRRSKAFLQLRDSGLWHIADSMRESQPEVVRQLSIGQGFISTQLTQWTDGSLSCGRARFSPTGWVEIQLKDGNWAFVHLAEVTLACPKIERNSGISWPSTSVPLADRVVNCIRQVGNADGWLSDVSPGAFDASLDWIFILTGIHSDWSRRKLELSSADEKRFGEVVVAEQRLYRRTFVLKLAFDGRFEFTGSLFGIGVGVAVQCERRERNPGDTGSSRNYLRLAGQHCAEYSRVAVSDETADQWVREKQITLGQPRPPAEYPANRRRQPVKAFKDPK